MSLLIKMFVLLFGPSEKGVTVWLDTCELQAKLLSILADFPRNSWNAYHASHDCIMFHSFRRGQPASDPGTKFVDPPESRTADVDGLPMGRHYEGHCDDD